VLLARDLPPAWPRDGHQRMPVGYGMVDEPQPGRRAFRNFHHASSQDLAGLRNAMGGSYSRQSANEPQLRYHLDFIHPQSPGPMTAAWSPSQHPAGIQNALEAYPQGYLDYTIFLPQPLTEDNRTGRAKRKALVVCSRQGGAA
jgi:hypothetical protein